MTPPRARELQEARPAARGEEVVVSPVSVSLVVPTLGRQAALHGLLGSLTSQAGAVGEVVVVDQNDQALERDDLGGPWPFPVRHLHTPGERGASRARNRGWRAAVGDVVLFPDDDCWYPPGALAAGLAAMGAVRADVLAGRAAAPDGRSINGRFEGRRRRVTRRNVWTTQIEWMTLFRRDVLVATDGYDEAVGVGAATPWQSCEAQDIVLRALEAGFEVAYEPDFVGHHPELDVRTPDTAMRAKGRRYARGHGHVLREHGYGLHDAAYWTMRPAIGAAISLARGRRRQATYRAGVALGRAEGYLGRTLSSA